MKTLQISDETYERIKDQLGAEDFDLKDLGDLIGKKFFFRTITYHLIGMVESRIGSFLRLSTASWIPDSGRFMNVIKDGPQQLSEIEPVGTAFVNLNSVTDFFPWNHDLPTRQK